MAAFTSPDLPPAFKARVSSVPARGRLLVASADLAPGHVVLRNAPFARVLRPALWSQRCFGCLGLLGESGIRSGAVWYCSGRCQQVDYLINHQIEGPLLETLRASVESDDILSDMLLVARTLRRVHAGSEAAAYDNLLSAGRDMSNIVQSSVSDVMDLVYHEPLDMTPVLEVGRSVVASGLLGPVAETLVDELEVANMLLRFGCNNFAVTSNLIVAIGAAVCPAGAILNHSCSPTCAVTWNPQTGAMEIRCVRPVTKGSELSHSYTDAAMPTVARRSKLRREYGFLCDCSRCTKPKMIKLAPAFRMELIQASRKHLADAAPSASRSAEEFFATKVETLASDAGREWDLDDCMQGDLLGQVLSVSDGSDGEKGDVTAALSTSSSSSLSSSSSSSSSSSASSSASTRATQLEYARARQLEAAAIDNDIDAKLTKLGEVNTLYGRWLHPLHLDRLQLCNDMLTVALAAGDYKAAVGHVRRTVSVYDHVYGNDYAHPMVGLQAYTMGNLYFEVQRYKEAIACLERSFHILRVTHGQESDLVVGLSSLLSQAQQGYSMMKAMQHPKGGPTLKKKKQKSKKKGKKGKRR